MLTPPGSLDEPHRGERNHRMLNDCRFLERVCPCCGSGSRDRVFDLPAESFCAPNWSYGRDYASILGIGPEIRFPITRCLACGFLYAELEPSSVFLAEVYDRVIRHDENRRTSESVSSFAGRMRYVADLLELAPGHGRLKALDYGCGLGITLRLLATAGIEVVGYEPSPVRANYLADCPARILRVADDLPALAPFDLIVCDNVLEHVPHPRQTLGFLASLAAPGAVLYVSVPNCDSVFVEAQRKAVATGSQIDMSLNPWEHLNYFDLPHLDRMLEAAGFTSVCDTELPGVVNIGLRAETGLLRRTGNVAASALRLSRYALTGSAVKTPNRAYYRFKGNF